MTKIFPQKKGRVFIPVIIGVVVLSIFIGIISGAIKIKFTASKTNQSKQLKIPSFSITPPSYYSKEKVDISKGELARYESSQIDTEKTTDGLITTNAVISIKVAGSYKNLDDFVNQYKASGSQIQDYQILNSSPQKINSENAYSIELSYKTKIGKGEVIIHELNYLLFKENFSFLVKGFTTESAWDKHSGDIRSALDSFKF